MRITSFMAFLLILFCVNANAQTDDVYILSLADIHLDPFIYCEDVTPPCPLIEKLSSANVSEWPALFAPFGAQMSVYRQDTNYALLSSALANAKLVAQKEHPQFIIVLGDFLGHEFRRKYYKYSQDKSRAGYRAFIYKTLEFLTWELKQAFPNTDVYSVVGNNDSYQSDYVSEPNGPFFHDAGRLWSSLINNAANKSRMQNDFSAAGYYAVTIPGQNNLRLIVLNTNLFSYLAIGRNVGQAALTQLAWLHQQLQMVQASHQKAIIAMHIPEGIDIFASLHTRLYTLIHLWKQQYIDSFDAEIAQFSPSVMAIFAGHLHADWYQTLDFDKTQIPYSGTPSISPIYGNNPGFKVYTYTPQDLKLARFVTHFYPLSYGRITGMEYGFNQFLNLQCDDCKMPDGTDVIHQTSMLYTLDNFFTPANISSNAQWSSSYQCAIQGGPANFPACDSE